MLASVKNPRDWPHEASKPRPKRYREMFEAGSGTESLTSPHRNKLKNKVLDAKGAHISAKQVGGRSGSLEVSSMDSPFSDRSEGRDPHLCRRRNGKRTSKGVALIFAKKGGMVRRNKIKDRCGLKRKRSNRASACGINRHAQFANY